jgi:hypothetical protein
MKQVATVVAVAVVALSGLVGCGASIDAAPKPQFASLEGPDAITVRAEGGTLWTAANSSCLPRRAWTMPAKGPVENLTVERLPEGGHVVTFCQGGAAWRGQLDESRTMVGSLSRTATCDDLPLGLASSMRGSPHPGFGVVTLR